MDMIVRHRFGPVRTLLLITATTLSLIFSGPVLGQGSGPTGVGQQILNLIGIDEQNLQQLIAVEQAPKIVFIGGKIIVPITVDLQSHYLLAFDASTGEWTRHVVDKSVWVQTIEPYLISADVPIVAQEAGSSTTMTAQEQALEIIGNANYNGFLVAVLSVYGSEAGAPVRPVNVLYEYDALGRLVRVVDPVNPNRNYDYDKAGNRKMVTEETGGQQ